MKMSAWTWSTALTYQVDLILIYNYLGGRDLGYTKWYLIVGKSGTYIDNVR